MIDCTVTSPPYYRQRDYRARRSDWPGGDARALRGSAWLDVFRECLRVTKHTGTLWLVLGDKYEEGQQLGLALARRAGAEGERLVAAQRHHLAQAQRHAVRRQEPPHDGSRVRISFHEDRTEYFYDADAIREPHVTFTEKSRMRGGPESLLQAATAPRNRARTAATRTCTMAAGIRRFTPRDATSGPSGRFRSPSSARPISPSFPSPGRDVHPGRLPPRRRGARPVPGQRHDGAVAPGWIGRYSASTASREYCDMAQRRLDQQQRERPLLYPNGGPASSNP